MKFGFLCITLLLLGACQLGKVPSATSYDFSTPVDTESRSIAVQDKKIFLPASSTVNAHNIFDGARLNGLLQINDTTYKASILPENSPINPSPWYAFKIWSSKKDTIRLVFDYGEYQHRYTPKVSSDGETWKILDDALVGFNQDSTQATFKMAVTPDTVIVAAQEMANTSQVLQWCKRMAVHPDVKLGFIGGSVQGRPIPELTLGHGKPKGKPVIALLSRQHPPEVTGFLALKAFLDEILENDSLHNDFLDRYRILVYPLMNPDGVDLGHWRHNAHGVDLNRDWAYYRQPETRKVADRLVAEVHKNNTSILVGMDFHSTYHDVYYTNYSDSLTSLPNFTENWLAEIKKQLKTDDLKVRPSAIGSPTSKNWFYTQFKAVGITYEIGDNTDREIIRKKGKISARIFMELLLNMR